MVCTARQAFSPPLAATFLLTICAAVRPVFSATREQPAKPKAAPKTSNLRNIIFSPHVHNVSKRDKVPKQTISLFAPAVLALAQIEGLTEPATPLWGGRHNYGEVATILFRGFGGFA